MATLILEGAQPFDLEAQNQPTPQATNGIVAMTVPVCVPGSPDNVVQIRILMDADSAEGLRRHLEPIVTTAKMQLRYQKP